jgi:hypothetical protein
MHEDLLRDMGPITDGEFITLQYNVNYALNNLGYVRINITTDPGGIIFALDNNGSPINNRLIIKLSYTYAHVDDVTQLPVEAYFTLEFDDGGTFGLSEVEHGQFWYWLTGIDPIVIYQYT